ncbi:beta-sarcoglycan-like [Physella acuta]|uniref:beta-sarcoglycan-like n=1 Tax=Physella acuta TaxID=109671 RepID=UPI0027DB9E7C|nr:beta-sarcoglycan-like [Physella acuta]
MNVSTTMSTLDTEQCASLGDVSTLGPRTDPRSPMSMGHLGASTLSMRAKAARKRKVNATHNSNFRAGYIPVEENALHRAGIRGRKRYFLYSIVGILIFIALLNITVTAWLVHILGMRFHGLESIELTSIRGRNFLRVLHDADISAMSFNDAPLGARYNSPLTLEANGSSVELKLTQPDTKSSLTLGDKNITVTTDNFHVRSNHSSEWLSTSLSSLSSHDLVVNLSVDNITTSQINSVKKFKDLVLESGRSVEVSGSQGLSLKSQRRLHMAAADIFIGSQFSTTSLTPKNGLHLDGNVPRVRSGSQVSTDLVTYQLCVCATGQLFKVRVHKPGQLCSDVGSNLLTVCGAGS